MSGQLRFEAWTLPTTGTFTRKIFSVPALPGATGRLELSGWSDCQMPVSESYSKLSTILSDTEGSLIRVLDGSTIVDEFIAERMPRDLHRPSVVNISGPQVAGLLSKIGVYPPDYPANPSARPNWVWAGENAAGVLELADLGSTREEYELYLSGERYTLDLALASAGDFTLSIGAETTDPLDWDTSAGTIESALEDFTAITDVDVIDHDDGSFTIDFRTPKNLASDMTISDSTTGGATLTKDADGFDTGSATFTVTVDGDTTEALDWDVSANNLEGSSETLDPPGSGLQGLTTVQDVTVSGSGVFDDPWVIAFYDPPNPGGVSVTFSAGTAILQRTVIGALDPSPVTKSKPADQGAGDEEQYGSYLNPPIQVITDAAHLDTDADWALIVNATGRYAGSQRIIGVIPGETYQAKIRVKPTTTGKYTLVFRTVGGDLIKNTTPRDVTLTAGSYQDLTVSDLEIPPGVDQVIMRVAVTDSRSSTWDPFYVNWQHAELILGMAAATPGDIVETLLEHAQGRGAGDWLDVSFSATADSGSTAWPQEYSYQADGFAMYMSDVMDDMRDLGIEFTVTPKASPSGGKTHDLNLWVSGGAGTDRTATGPALMAGGAIVDGQVVSRIPAYTTAVGWGADDLYLEDTDATTGTNFGRLERFLDVEQHANSDSLQDVVDAAFADEQSNRLAGSVTLRGGGKIVPLVDFGLGDTLVWQAPPAMTKNDRRVQSISWRSGNPVAEYEIQGSRVWDGEAALWKAVERLLDRPKKRKRFRGKAGKGDPVATFVPPGAHIHLTRATAQSIPSGTATAIEWSALSSVLEPKNFSTPSFNTAAVTIQEPGYYDIKVELGFDSISGAAVSVTRERSGSETTVGPLAADPGIWTVSYATSLFSDVVKGIECLSGDVIRVYFEQSSGSAVDLTGVLTVELVDRILQGNIATPDVITFKQDGGPAADGLEFILPEAPAEGDVLLLAVAGQNASLNSVSGSGWDTLASEAPGGDRYFYVMAKDAGASESATVTVTLNDLGLLDNVWGTLIHLTGAAYPPADYDHNQGANGEGDIAPSVSSSGQGLLLVVWQASHGFGDVPAGLTELVTANTAGGAHYQVGYRVTTGAATGDYEADVDVETATGMGTQIAFSPRIS